MGLPNGYPLFMLIAGFIVGILIVREIAMWYWKINKIVDQLELQNEILKHIAKEITEK